MMSVLTPIWMLVLVLIATLLLVLVLIGVYTIWQSIAHLLG